MLVEKKSVLVVSGLGVSSNGQVVRYKKWIDNYDCFTVGKIVKM